MKSDLRSVVRVNLTVKHISRHQHTLIEVLSGWFKNTNNFSTRAHDLLRTCPDPHLGGDPWAEKDWFTEPPAQTPERWVLVQGSGKLLWGHLIILIP